MHRTLRVQVLCFSCLYTTPYIRNRGSDIVVVVDVVAAAVGTTEFKTAISLQIVVEIRSHYYYYYKEKAVRAVVLRAAGSLLVD